MMSLPGSQAPGNNFASNFLLTQLTCSFHLKMTFANIAVEWQRSGNLNRAKVKKACKLSYQGKQHVGPHLSNFNETLKAESCPHLHSSGQLSVMLISACKSLLIRGNLCEGLAYRGHGNITVEWTDCDVLKAAAPVSQLTSVVEYADADVHSEMHAQNKTWHL